MVSMSPPTERSPFVSMKVRRDSRDRLHAAIVRLTSPVGRTLTLSEVVDALAGLSERHQAELVRELRGES